MLQCRRGREVVDDAVVSKEHEIPRFGPARKKKDSKSKTGRTMKKAQLIAWLALPLALTAADIQRIDMTE